MASIPAPAAALYNFLASLFEYIDEQVEPRCLGVITVEKSRWVAEKVGMQAEFAASLSQAPEVLADTYSDLECQYYIVPSSMGKPGTHEYGFEEADSPGLPKRGWIKMQALALILEADGGSGIGGLHYRYLNSCLTTFNLARTDPITHQTVTFPPLPPPPVVTAYVSSLATSHLGIVDPSPAAVQARMASRRKARLEELGIEDQTPPVMEQYGGQQQQQQVQQQQPPQQAMYNPLTGGQQPAWSPQGGYTNVKPPHAYQNTMGTVIYS